MKIANYLKLAISLSLIVILSACEVASSDNINLQETSIEDTKNVEEEKVDILGDNYNMSETGMKINSANKFILKNLEKQEKDNIVFSNTGIQSVLAMIKYAAKGNTKEQLDKINGNFNKDLNSESVNIYNFLVVNEKNDKVKTKTSFIDRLKEEKWIRGNLFTLDSKNSPKDVAGEVNKNIETETNGQIKDAVSENDYSDEDLVMQLGNVIHFLGNWEYANKENPYKLKNYYFKNRDNKNVSAEFVVLGENDAKLIENDDIIGLTLNYKEEFRRYSFVAFLPKDEANFSLDKLDVEHLNFYNDLRYRLNARFPKFEFDNNLNLTKILVSLGLTDLFDEAKADLSEGFEFDRAVTNAYASYCKQKSVIRVDECGTEASAFTSIGVVNTTAMMNPHMERVRYVDLTFNRPFYFMIHDSNVNMPLFIGEVNTLTDTKKPVDDKDKNVETIVDRIIEEEISG